MKNLYVVAGLGITGLSCIRYLTKKGMQVAVTDTRVTPPFLTELKKDFPKVTTSFGQLDEALLLNASTIILSPGISLTHPNIKKAVTRHIEIIGDIELFARENKLPVIAITGTNGKSTVTTMVTEMAKEAGLHPGMGGNIGNPALDFLAASDLNLIVLELSSFQLETTFSLKKKVGCFLNLSNDHMDRYDDIKDYQKAKQRIYEECEIAVCNKEDKATFCNNNEIPTYFFTVNPPKQNEFGLLEQNNEMYLAFENNIIMACQDLPVKNLQHTINALAALAIGHAYGFSFASMIAALKGFKGLPHRCQWLRERLGVNWYNDSKGTNVGATLAAILGLSKGLQGKIVLIAGGVGKNADFTPLIPLLQKYVKTVILLGEAAALLADLFKVYIPIVLVNSMEEAVIHAAKIAHKGDSVLLSPACASTDMFKNFEHRGEVFSDLVHNLNEI